jgi:hypothetical protein
MHLGPSRPPSRLQLHICARSERKEVGQSPSRSRTYDDNLNTALTELFPGEQRISSFPRADAEQELYNLLNPPTHLGSVQGVTDDRIRR